MQKLKQIPKRVHHFLIGLVLTAVLGVLAFAVVNTYTAYTDMVVQQQQQYLLVTARAVSKTLSLYISGQLRDIEILTRSPGFLTEFENYYETGGDTALREHIVSYMLSQKRGVKRIYLLDKNGDVMYQYNDYPFLEVFDESLLHLKECAAAHTSGIGSVFRISPQHYGLMLVNDVIHGSESLGTVVIVIDLEQVYEEYLAPLNIENTGDIIVKNEKGTIIMHPNAKLLTFNPFRQIQELDTLPQYKGLNELLTRQYSQEEGTAIYRDYSNGIAPPEDEIAAFSRMNVNNTAWYVSAVLPYSTVKTSSTAMWASLVCWWPPSFCAGRVRHQLLRHAQKPAEFEAGSRLPQGHQPHPERAAPEPRAGVPLPETSDHRRAGERHRA